MPGSVAPELAFSAEQRMIIDLPLTSSGVVIGAPGTGKTTVAVERVRAILDAGVLRPNEVLLLTPSRQTATRVRDVLGVQTTVATPGPLARSVGSLAFLIVRSAMVASAAAPPQLLTGADQDRLIADLLEGDLTDEEAGEGRWPVEVLPASARASKVFRSELRTFLAECAQLGVGSAELAALAERAGNDVWLAISSFMQDYRGVLASMRSEHRESAELISEAAELLRTADAQALGAAAALRVVVVDDAQELTRGGVDFLLALRARGVAVLAFGDPDISSGSFRGATPHLFADLAAALGAVHVLTDPHRQGGALLHATRSITQAIGAGGRVDHRLPPGEAPQPDESVTVRLAASPFEEADLIARTLREWHVLSGVAWNQMAVIAHDTRQVAMLEAELAAREVPTRAAGIQRPLGQESAVRDILRVVQLAMTPPHEWQGADLASVLLSPFGGLDAVGVRRLRARLRHRELNDSGARSAEVLLASAMAVPLDLALIDTPEARAALRVAQTLGDARAAYLRGDTVHDLLWLVWDRSYLFGRPLAEVWRDQSRGSGIVAAEASRSLDALVALFDAAKRSVERAPEAPADAFVRELLESDVPEDSLASPQRAQSVTLMTPATALGAEFDAVVIAGVQDGVWPNVRLRGTLLDTWQLPDVVAAYRSGTTEHVPPAATDRRKIALYDELRLFVRAVSRAKTRLLVTAVDDDDLGPSPLLSFLPTPSEGSGAEHPLTLRGLVAEHRRTLTSVPEAATEERHRAASELSLLASHGVPGADPLQWFGVAEPTSTAPLRDPQSSPVPVSPSRLDGFETCPTDWAIRTLGGNTSSFSQGLGVILHSAMEQVPDGDAERIAEIVAQRWGELQFEAGWLSEKERRWAGVLIDRLASYLRNFAAQQGEMVGAEAEFELVVPFDASSIADVKPRVDGEKVELPAAIVRGNIDRVERYRADKGELVPFDPSREGLDRVVIVDLKTGKSEDRVSDAKVTDDAQLAAYQLAVRSGALEGVDPESGAGARLVVISKDLPSKNMRYRIAHQQTLDDQQQRDFIARIVDAANGMAANTFAANVDAHCSHERFAVCRIHTVGAVSAS